MKFLLLGTLMVVTPAVSFAATDAATTIGQQCSAVAKHLTNSRGQSATDPSFKEFTDLFPMLHFETVQEGEAVSMDYRQNRVRVIVNKKGEIKIALCG